jgi:hypothetical protein
MSEFKFLVAKVEFLNALYLLIIFDDERYQLVKQNPWATFLVTIEEV